MMYRIYLLAAIIVTLSCRKEKEEKNTIPVAELLTKKSWVLTSYGFDENRNNQIHPAEESVEECQKDNTWHYYPDGTGFFDDNILSCATGIERQPFTWKLTQEQKVIDFFYDSLKILRLTGEEMILYKELNFSNTETVRLLTVFRH